MVATYIIELVLDDEEGVECLFLYIYKCLASRHHLLLYILYKCVSFTQVFNITVTGFIGKLGRHSTHSSHSLQRVYELYNIRIYIWRVLDAFDAMVPCRDDVAAEVYRTSSLLLYTYPRDAPSSSLYMPPMRSTERLSSYFLGELPYWRHGECVSYVCNTHMYRAKSSIGIFINSHSVYT